MKILESKYYKPTKFLISDEECEERVLLQPDYWLSSNTPYSSLLNVLLSDALPYNTDLTIQSIYLKDFIKCTDFVCYKYSKIKNQLIEQESCYYHPEYEVFITLTPDLSLEWDKELFEEGTLKVKGIYFDNTNHEHDQRLIYFFNQYIQKYSSTESKISVLIKEPSGFELRTHTIKPYSIQLETMYNDDFIPVHQHIKQQLSHHNKGIVLLHGLAGTGKTNYLKWLTSQIPDKKFIFVPTTIIHLLTDPSFINLLIDNKNSILVLEDCENYIAERTANNPHTDVVASILNIADGILSDIVECQMICTFNASIDKIDTALLRKGRLIAEYRFKQLSIEKANQYLKSIDSNLLVDQAMTLAEITHIKDEEFREKEQNKPKIGFLA